MGIRTTSPLVALSLETIVKALTKQGMFFEECFLSWWDAKSQALHLRIPKTPPSRTSSVEALSQSNTGAH